MASKSKKRYVFSLMGINIERIDAKYGITTGTALLEDDTIPSNTTKIEELEIVKKTPDIVSFLDESKRLRKCTVSMINFSEKKKYKCFWDKNTIPENVKPIGCPIRYVSSRAIKTYNSEMTKEKYVISEPVTEKRIKSLKNRKDDRFSIDKKGYYETDGIFCSVNCCMAFIQDPENKRNPLYQNSESLLLQMYMEMHSAGGNGGDSTGVDGEDYDNLEIIPAPHWRTLVDFGGTMTIKQFRETFNKVMYINHGVISCRSLGNLFEDQIKF